MVSARFTAMITSNKSKKKYKHLFLHPYIPIFSVSGVASLLSSCISNGSVSVLLSALDLLIIVRNNMGVDLQCKRLLLNRIDRGAFIDGYLCKKCQKVLEKILVLYWHILFNVKISD